MSYHSLNIEKQQIHDYIFTKWELAHEIRENLVPQKFPPIRCVISGTEPVISKLTLEDGDVETLADVLNSRTID